MQRFIHFISLAAALCATAHVIECVETKSDLLLTDIEVAPDGFPRTTIGVNGVFPSPLIKANKGDRFELNVIDALTDVSILRGTSIHWHGIFQDNTSWADGPSFVTQCPISPGHSFLYDFTPTRQAGTFWYHSHLALQYCDGLRGPLVIYDPQDPFAYLYDVDDETTIITLADWNHFTTTNMPFPPIFSSTLINGLGRYPEGPLSPLALITVKHGMRYRFRMVNMACDPDYVFSVMGHNLTIIEVDGVNHQPLVVDSIHIYVGQRYSFILKANQKIDNYWIQAIPNYGNTGTANATNSAILRYVGAPIADPTVNLTSNNPLIETNLHPLIPSPVPGAHHVGGADVSINLVIGVNITAKTYTLGGATFVPPTVPALLQILSGAQLAQELLPSGSYYALPPNKVIEVSIPGGSDPGIPHPFHLHGHTFHVVRSAGSSVYNWKNPPIRDVVSTGTAAAGDNVTFRFVTDNAGPWFLHCHIDYHLNTGLAVVFAEDAATLAKERFLRPGTTFAQFTMH
ncbi:laccase [Mycena sp. CBHHK59/15]|nr:laccase [Mycena sp. CBHHK59/15]